LWPVDLALFALMVYCAVALLVRGRQFARTNDLGAMPVTVQAARPRVAGNGGHPRGREEERDEAVGLARSDQVVDPGASA
jgi:hypothetical protein